MSTITARITYMSPTGVTQRLVQAQIRNGLQLGDELAAPGADVATWLRAHAHSSPMLTALANTSLEQRLLCSRTDADWQPSPDVLTGQSLVLISRVIAGPVRLADGSTAEVVRRTRRGCCRTRRLAGTNTGLETITTLGAL